MEQFYDSLMSLVTKDIVNGIAKSVEESPDKIKKAASATIPSLLAIYLKTHNPDINNVVREAGNLNILNSFGKSCREDVPEYQAHIGDNFLQKMLGDRAIDLTTPIAEHSGISKVASNRLIYLMSMLVAGYLGEKLKKDKWSESRLLTELRKAKGSFVSDIPSAVVKEFGLSYILKSDNKVSKDKGRLGYVVWGIVILLLLLLGFLAIR